MKFWHRLTVIATLAVAVLSIAALLVGVAQSDPPSSDAPTPPPESGNVRSSTTGL